MQNNIINLGPQHPSTHGVLRLILELEGETLQNMEIEIGYLHRGSEKLGLSGNELKRAPYTTRMDYVSPFHQKLAYFLNRNSAERHKTIVVDTFLTKLTRILNHTLVIATLAMDLGMLTQFLLTFEIREKIFQLFEEISGARMHHALIAFSAQYPAANTENLIRNFFYQNARGMLNAVGECLNFVSQNVIMSDRLSGLGLITSQRAINLGVTGPCLRATGVELDVRTEKPYLLYPFLPLQVPTYASGDGLARINIRLLEILESLNLLALLVDQPKIEYARPKIQMEEVINSSRKFVKSGVVYTFTESPKGILAIRSAEKRFRVKSPDFSNLRLLKAGTNFTLLSDVLACLGTLDIVLGSVDR